MMYIYLSKKISIANNTKLSCIAWNKEDDYIAIGGLDGLLKILKLNNGSDAETGYRNKLLGSSGNLTLNQTLQGHSGCVQILAWNEHFKKLTTSDQNGLIIVWTPYKGLWCEEMINNRKKSMVVGMHWSSDGLKICIIYQDGAIIVGAVDGNRLWGKEIKNFVCTGVQWSPDTKLLLFALKNGELHLYDALGNFIMRIPVVCLDETNQSIGIVALDWYNGLYGKMHAFCPNLLICYKNGRLQLMRNENDNDPVVVYTKLAAVHASWNHNGSLLAVAGVQYGDDKDTNVVQFYNPFGQHLRTLKVPGISISCCVWEGGSLRIAMAVDSYIYFANIHPDYKWCYFKKIVVYTSSNSQKSGICVSFWNTGNNQCHNIFVPVLLGIAGYGDHCVLVTRSDSDETVGRYGLNLYNTLGLPVDEQLIDLEPNAVTMNSTHVFALSRANFVVWQFKTAKHQTHFPSAKVKCRVFHIDENLTGALEVIQDLDNTNMAKVNTSPTSDPACCITASDKCLIIGRESGLMQYYALPHIALSNRYKIESRPYKMAINCNSSRLAVIDVAGVMNVIDISEGIGRPNTSIDPNSGRLERKDVWSMCWAKDNPQLLAIMEKTRLYIFKGTNPEEPLVSCGYLCSFNDLEIQVVTLDDIIQSPEPPNNSDHLIKLEIKSLRDTRQLLDKVGIKEAELFIEENPHPRLWRLLAEQALKELNLTMAELAFVKSRDYPGVLFVKKLNKINSEKIRKASIAAYFKDFDEAEKIYMDLDRSDLALNLRETLGDWFRVIHMVKSGAAAPDSLLYKAYSCKADDFRYSNNFTAAVEYYSLAGNTAKMIDCYFLMEDYESIILLVRKMPERDPLLKDIADQLVLSGAITEAMDTYIKFGDINCAIEVGIQHNRWDFVMRIAKEYNIANISNLLIKYTSHLVEQGTLLKAIEVNLQAEFYLHAAQNAFMLANQEAKNKSNNLLLVKKHYVYAAYLLEYHRKHPNKDETVTYAEQFVFENCWKGAEAYHFYMLAHEQLYNGKLHDALCTAYKLQEYLDYLSAVEVYSLLATASLLDHSFGVCNKALIKLKMLENISETNKVTYEKLCWNIFTTYEPKDVRQNKVKCSNCSNLIPDWSTTCSSCNTHFSTCIVSGKSIIDGIEKIVICKHCHHSALESFVRLQKICVLCHTAII